MMKKIIAGVAAAALAVSAMATSAFAAEKVYDFTYTVGKITGAINATGTTINLDATTLTTVDNEFITLDTVAMYSKEGDETLTGSIAIKKPVLTVEGKIGDAAKTMTYVFSLNGTTNKYELKTMEQRVTDGIVDDKNVFCGDDFEKITKVTLSTTVQGVAKKAFKASTAGNTITLGFTAGTGTLPDALATYLSDTFTAQEVTYTAEAVKQTAAPITMSDVADSDGSDGRANISYNKGVDTLLDTSDDLYQQYIDFATIPGLDGMAQATAKFFQGYEDGKIIMTIGTSGSVLDKQEGNAAGTGNGDATFDPGAGNTLNADGTINLTDSKTGSTSTVELGELLAIAFNFQYGTAGSFIACKAQFEKDADGKLKKDANGDYVIVFDITEFVDAVDGNTMTNIHDMDITIKDDLFTAMNVTAFGIKSVKFVAEVESDAVIDVEGSDAENTDDEPAEETTTVEDTSADASEDTSADASEDTSADASEDTSADASEDTSADNGDAGVDGENTKGDNTETGVVLAVVPAIIAGAALVASRKRK